MNAVILSVVFSVHSGTASEQSWYRRDARRINNTLLYQLQVFEINFVESSRQHDRATEKMIDRRFAQNIQLNGFWRFLNSTRSTHFDESLSYLPWKYSRILLLHVFDSGFYLRCCCLGDKREANCDLLEPRKSIAQLTNSRLASPYHSRSDASSFLIPI